MTIDADVVIVGGGPAGMATALFLIDHGIDVVLLERSDKPHAIPVPPPIIRRRSKCWKNLALQRNYINAA